MNYRSDLFRCLLFAFLFLIYTATISFGQEVVATIPLKGIYKSFESFEAGDSTIILCTYERTIRKRESPTNALRSAVIVGPNGETKLIDVPDSVSKKTLAVTTSQTGFYLHTVATRNKVQFLETLFFDHEFEKLSVRRTERLPMNVLGYRCNNEIEFLASNEFTNSIELYRYREGALAETKIVALPKDLLVSKLHSSAIIWDGATMSRAEAGSPSKLYILKDQVVVTYDHVTNRKNNFTEVHIIDKATKKTQSYRIENSTGFHFRTTWHNGKLYSVSKNKDGFYVRIYVGEMLEKEFNVMLKTDLAERPAFPGQSATVAHAIRKTGPPFIILHEDSEQVTMEVGAQLVEKKSGAVVVPGPFMLLTIVGSVVIHSLSDEMYVNPTYFYLKASNDSGASYIPAPLFETRRLQYESSASEAFWYKNYLGKASSRAVYVTDRSYLVNLVRFDRP
jgi:hypothetical protein